MSQSQDPYSPVSITTIVSQEGEEERALPFRMLIVSDVYGEGAQTGDAAVALAERYPRPLLRQDFDGFLADCDVALDFEADDCITPAGDDGEAPRVRVSYPVRSMADLSPAGVITNVPLLQELLKLREAIVTTKAVFRAKLPAKARIRKLIADRSADAN